MAQFESTLLDLLRDIATLLPRVDPSSMKWVVVANNDRELRPARNEELAAFHAYAQCSRGIRALPSFTTCEQAFNADAELARASKQAGYLGSFNGFLQTVIQASARVRRRRVTFLPRQQFAFVDFPQAVRKKILALQKAS